MLLIYFKARIVNIMNDEWNEFHDLTEEQKIKGGEKKWEKEEKVGLRMMINQIP